MMPFSMILHLNFFFKKTALFLLGLFYILFFSDFLSLLTTVPKYSKLFYLVSYKGYSRQFVLFVYRVLFRVYIQFEC